MSSFRTLRLACTVFALALAACGGSSGDGSVAPITVVGTVVDSNGAPIPGVTAFILGAAPVTTDAAGEFVIDGVTPPYDLLVVSIHEDAAVLFVGLTDPDPYLDPSFRHPTARSATISGTLAAGVDSDFTTPNPVDTYTVVAAHADVGGGRVLSNPSESAGTFAMDAYWTRDASLDGALHALQYTQVDGVVNGVVAYGTKPFSSVDDLEDAAAGEITMNPVSPATLGGSVELGGELEIARVSTGVILADGYTFSLSDDESGATAFEQVVPDLPGAEGFVAALATPPGSDEAFIAVVRAGLELPTEDIAITIPDLPFPNPVSPA